MNSECKKSAYMHKSIYFFGVNDAKPASYDQNNLTMQRILGGKGAGLAQMSTLNMPIPPGFTISTEICTYYYKHKSILPLEFIHELDIAVKKLEEYTGKKLGDSKNPLLLSVRSGAVSSMPGMMDTILNLGMNDEVAAGLADVSGNEVFALDSYRRFLEMYGSIVLGVPRYLFEDVFENHKIQKNIIKDQELSAKTLQEIIADFKRIILKHSGMECPRDPREQLKAAICAVLKSWMSERAIIYRKLHNLSDELGTAVNVQSMVFGNLGDNSATGVVFSRCPARGENKIFGEFLVNAQGEDVVAGIRTPMPIATPAGESAGASMQSLMPDLFGQLKDICQKLEAHYKDVQDIEFTIENGKLFILQTRAAKRTAAAAIKIAVDLQNEGVISKQEAIMRIDPESINQLLHAGIDYKSRLEVLAQGLPASPGAANGIIVFSPHDAEQMSAHHKVILVRNDTSPEDIKGMYVSAGVLTARGGMTSHAAVVARGMGKPCVCGISRLIVNENERYLKIGDITLKQGDEVTIDGSTGKVFIGKVPLLQPEFSKEFQTILSWADEHRKLAVRANAETPMDSMTAIKFGAEGIGLCRTEHMFFDADKIPLVQEMIVAPDAQRRISAIEKLLPLQIKDFKELFRIMRGLPINIRLLDPPLHEFLPVAEADKEKLAKTLQLPVSAINQRLHALHEVNPMLGHRGCRLGITYPEIYKMQVEAIFTAMAELKEQEQLESVLELMIPLISNINELKVLKNYIAEIAEKFPEIRFTLGTMIELPRAALMAGEIAREVEYFSFGTNDLTQTTYGISRDDIASFLPCYLEQKIFEHDPFIELDQRGVGELIKIAAKRGRESKSGLKLGVCGEHAGNGPSIEFFHNAGLDYISCSPYRIPIARLAAAQAQIKSSVTSKENL